MDPGASRWSVTWRWFTDAYAGGRKQQGAGADWDWNPGDPRARTGGEHRARTDEAARAWGPKPPKDPPPRPKGGPQAGRREWELAAGEPDTFWGRAAGRAAGRAQDSVWGAWEGTDRNKRAHTTRAENAEGQKEGDWGGAEEEPWAEDMAELEDTNHEWFGDDWHQARPEPLEPPGPQPGEEDVAARHKRK